MLCILDLTFKPRQRQLSVSWVGVSKPYSQHYQPLKKKETVIELMNFFLESNKMTERIYLDISNISNSTTIVHIATKITKVVLTFQTMWHIVPLSCCPRMPTLGAGRGENNHQNPPYMVHIWKVFSSEA